jgi:hypothetical protein
MLSLSALALERGGKEEKISGTNGKGVEVPPEAQKPPL